jgi:ferric-dicitrate binding protein FerR (iron transport regulator)
MVLAFSAATLHAQTAGPANARLVARNGLVEVERGNVWLPISMGDPLNPGERIRTSQGSSAALEVGVGKVITLNEQTQIQVRPSTGMPAVQLESGSMKVFAATDIQLAAKDTILEAAETPLDMEIGYQADKLNLTVFDGAVRSGAITIRAIGDSGVRTYTADSRNAQRNAGPPVEYPNFYIYPYFMYGSQGPNGRAPGNGAIVPPVVNNPTNPGYRPTQIVPPMSDPIHVPVTKQ